MPEDHKAGSTILQPDEGNGHSQAGLGRFVARFRS